MCLKRMATGRKRGGIEHTVGNESRTPVLIDVNVTVPLADVARAVNTRGLLSLD